MEVVIPRGEWFVSTRVVEPRPLPTGLRTERNLVKHLYVRSPGERRPLGELCMLGEEGEEGSMVRGVMVQGYDI